MLLFESICSLLLVSCLAQDPTVGPTQSPTTEAHAFAEAVNSFGTELSSLFCDGLSVGGAHCDSYGISNFVDSLSADFEHEATDAYSTVEAIIERVDDALQVRADFLTALSESLNVSCSEYRWGGYSNSESLANFDSMFFSGNDDRQANLPSDIDDSSVYGDTVSLTASTYKIPDGVDYFDEHIQLDAKITMLMEDTMISLHDEHCVDDDGNGKYCSMYFGTINGVFRQFPGVESPIDDSGDYVSYDPRFRPWYVSAASGNKDVVIILDISGSMQTADRISLAKSAVVSVLSTLGSSSMVAVIAFNHELTKSCFGDELVAATPRNVDKLIDFVNSLGATGSTDFEIAFEAAFDILEHGSQSCKSSILFLTDGIADDPSDIISDRNTADVGATIFSYTLGDGADTRIPAAVANMTNGVYTHIDDNDESLINKMSSYYMYYALGDTANNDMVITSPYLDFATGAAMITMALPVYFSDYFVGVVGIDLPLTFLSEAIGDVIIGRKSYSFITNIEGEVILHPLVPDPMTTLFAEGEEYNAVFIDDLEPAEFDTSLLTSRSTGSTKIHGTVKVAAGDVEYNGYVREEADIMYFYSVVGPNLLSLGIAIYTDDEMYAHEHMVAGFGLKGSPSTKCDEDDAAPSNCRSSFVLYHDLELMDECEVSFFSEAEIHYTSIDSVQSAYSEEVAAWYLQAGGYESPMDAVNLQPTCDELEAIHTLTNDLGQVTSEQLPFDGFRGSEHVPLLWAKLFNTVQTLPAMGQFWKPSYLAEDSVFHSLYFSSYQGLFIMFPAHKISPTYNAMIRPWYQRAVSYPGSLVFTTPYVDAFTGLLVASGAVTIDAPNSSYPFGVAAFDYEFSEFLSFWDATMSDVCDQNDGHVCYLIDSSAFLLWFDGIDANDADISHKFLGDVKPELMQSLLERGFFENCTHDNYLSNTRDISYMADEDKYVELDMNGTASEFGYNHGVYKVHKVGETNLFLIHIDGYQVDNSAGLLSGNCPDTGCELVRTPGCITDNGECVSVVSDVCTNPDELATPQGSCTAPVVEDNVICILEKGVQSDMCASVFARDCDHYDAAKEASSIMAFIIVMSCAILSQ